MLPAQPVELGFSPLDDELGLLPGSLTPQAEAALLRLGVEQDFEPAVELLAALTGIVVSDATVRRHTYATGDVLLDAQTAAAPALAPPADPGPDTHKRLQLSADGAMIPLVGGSWAEVKTLVIGEVEVVEVEPQGAEKGAGEGSAQSAQVHAKELSYFSRLSTAEEFTRLAVVETARRGVRAAAAVGGVMDGALWLQGLLDYHRPDAVRILDQPHALGHLHELGLAVWGEGETARDWWAEHKQLLKEKGGDAVLEAVEPLAELAQDRENYRKHHDYLLSRREQMRYREFRAGGWPVGSGIVESGNKVVVERRLKGAGKRWSPAHVNPMLVLRNAVCSGSSRWAEAVADGAVGRREAVRARQAEQRRRRREAATQGLGQEVSGQKVETMETMETMVVAQAEQIVMEAQACALESGNAASPALATTRERWRPASNHPWRRSTIGRACADQPLLLYHAKL